jgi:hypothetical protein
MLKKYDFFKLNIDFFSKSIDIFEKSEKNKKLDVIGEMCDIEKMLTVADDKHITKILNKYLSDNY